MKSTVLYLLVFSVTNGQPPRPSVRHLVVIGVLNLMFYINVKNTIFILKFDNKQLHYIIRKN